MHQEILEKYSNDMRQELHRILHYWKKHTPDELYGGFYGKIDHNNTVFPHSPKGAVLNSRILWAFSAAFHSTGDAAYETIATRAMQYVTSHFIDKESGGVYWSTDHLGRPLETKKQTYAIAFALYGLSEYYKSKADNFVKEKAIGLYNDIMQHAHDKKYGGYFEAFSKEWAPIKNSRLSAKDANEKKSMNTHLHVIEAFTNLYSIWPDTSLKKNIEGLLELFSLYIINKQTHHLHLFFEENWKVKSTTISFGHDIEAAWLLQEAARVIGNENYIKLYTSLAINIAAAATEGLDKDGGLWYELQPGKNLLIKQKHSWPQAEAMIGFFNAWQITREERFLQLSLNAWKFTSKYLIDIAGGEWVWGVNENYTVMAHEDKVGIWKCPYHNSRACIEIIKRINNLP